VFKSELQPVEVASAVQHEMDERAAMVAKARTLVPTRLRVRSRRPCRRLDIMVESLSLELATLPEIRLRKQGLLVRWTGADPVRGIPDLATGHVPHPVRGDPRAHRGGGRGSAAGPRLAARRRWPVPGRPRTSGAGSQPGTGLETGSTYELQTPVTLLGRGTDCDLTHRSYPGVLGAPRRAAREDGQVVLVDLDPPMARSGTGSRCVASC